MTARKRILIAAIGVGAVAVKLEMREVGAMPIDGAHAVERGRHVSGHSQVVAMDVGSVRQAKLVRRPDERLENRARGDATRTDRRVELRAIPAATLSRG